MKIPPPHFAIEPLEARIAPATFTVINVADSGPGSFRQAILDANGNPGADTIAFAIPTLQLPVITPLSMLPAITDTVVIDALLSGGPKVTIDGTHAVGADGVNNGSGLMLYGKASSGSTIRGMVIYGFDIAGIEIQQSSSNTIVSNILGLNSSEGSVPSHMQAGVLISSGDFNKIGTEQGSNTIGGNDYGVRISGGQGTSILSNRIGLSSGGARPNDIGILVQNASSTTIGSSNAKNTVSGNLTFGIKLSTGTTATNIRGNIIGLDPTGAASVGNQEWGIFIDGATYTSIGTENTPNVISGNASGGIWFHPGTLESNTSISGNLIGTTSSGSAVPLYPGTKLAVGNGGPGILVIQSSLSVFSITSNLISGNSGAGIEVHNFATLSNATITGNVIGADISGTKALGNGSGIILDGAGHTTIGGAGSLGNTIVASSGDGLLIKNCTNVNVWGNNVGYAPRAQTSKGFGNAGNGIHLQGIGTINIGTTGNAAIGNAIDGNGGDGIYYEGSAPNPRGLTPTINIHGNFVGTDGFVAQGNVGIGIHATGLPARGSLKVGSPDSEPTLSRTGLGNLISANGGDGIRIERADNVVISGNYIGISLVDFEHRTATALGNHGDGIALIDSSYASIGGSKTGGVIAGNLGNGISVVGTTRTVTSVTIGSLFVGGVAGSQGAIGNLKNGVFVDGTATNIHVGKFSSQNGYFGPNCIQANQENGVYFGEGVSNSSINGNQIGYSTVSLGFTRSDAGNSGNGIVVRGQINQIYQNGIANSGDAAIEIRSTSDSPDATNSIRENRIGFIEDTNSPLAGQGDGIRIIGSTHVVVGGDGPLNANIVYSDTGAALRLIGAKGARVWNNRFTSLGSDAVVFEGGTTETEFGADFGSNTVTSLAGAGIVIVDGTNNRLLDNFISTARSGVLVLSGTGNEISQNHFTISEGGLFIDLGGDGVTPNDPLDADNGPNLLQNSPLLVSAALSGGQTLLRGEYRGAANVDVRIEWYVGGEFLTASDVHTDANGIAKLSLNLDQQFDAGTTFSASATSDANTSEFSGSVAAAIPPQVIAKGALPGHAPRVRLLDASTHEVVMSTLAFGKNFHGGVSVSAADVDGDGYTDLVATSRTGAPVVKIFSGLDGHVISQFRVGNAGDSSVRSIAAGDLDGDGTVEVVIGRAKTMGGTVSVYDALTGTREAQFTPFGFNTPDTLRVSLQDIDGDQHPEVIVRASILSGIKQVALDPLSGQIEKVARALVS